MTKIFGFEIADWNTVKSEMRAVLVERAKMGEMIPYSELVAQVASIKLDPSTSALAAMLSKMSVSEDEAGRGLLSVLVVHKSGDMKPGDGFFELAKARGRETSDIDRCWIEEVKKVQSYWSGPN